MAGSLNAAFLIGHLGRDPETRFAQDGTKIVNFSMATSDTWKDRESGERKERTSWHRVVIFNEHLADIAEKYLKKGSFVFLRGEMQTRKWTAQDGTEKYTTEVVLSRYRGELLLLDKMNSGPPPAGDQDDYGTTTTKERRDPAEHGPDGPAEWEQTGGAGSGGAPSNDLDDTIPFHPEWR